MSTTTKKRRTLEDAVLVRSEPRQYEPESPHSFFIDLARTSARLDGAAAASERLARHRRECEVELETRAGVTTASGSADTFAPPMWAVDRFATVARAGRVLGDLVTCLPLPGGVASVHMPKMTTGADAAIQPAQGDPVQSTDEVTADAKSDVVTISGEGDVSQQLYDLTPTPPGYDGIIYKDLSLAYNQNLEKQLLAGTGTNGQLTGVQNVSGINTVTFTSGSPTLTLLWPILGQALAAIANTRLLPAEVWLMAGRRWAWIASALDSSSRPIASPGQGPHTPDVAPAGGTFPVGPIDGRPVYEDGAIPAGTSADVILALRASDMLLYESEPRFTAVVNPLGGTLQIRCQLRRYCAFINQKPSSITLISGTGLAQPAGY